MLLVIGIVLLLLSQFFAVAVGMCAEKNKRTGAGTMLILSLVLMAAAVVVLRAYWVA